MDIRSVAVIGHSFINGLEAFNRRHGEVLNFGRNVDVQYFGASGLLFEDVFGFEHYFSDFHPQIIIVLLGENA